MDLIVLCILGFRRGLETLVIYVLPYAAVTVPDERSLAGRVGEI
jgi:hypothetical protein